MNKCTNNVVGYAISTNSRGFYKLVYYSISKKIIKLKKELSQQHALIERVLNPLSAQIDSFKSKVPLLQGYVTQVLRLNIGK